MEATSPAALKNYLAQSLQRLGTEYIDIDSLGAGERKGHRAPGRKRDHLDESLGALFGPPLATAGLLHFVAITALIDRLARCTVPAQRRFHDRGRAHFGRG